MRIDEKEYMRLLQCERDLETVREVMMPILESIYHMAEVLMAQDRDIPDITMVNFSFENAGALMMALSPSKGTQQ